MTAAQKIAKITRLQNLANSRVQEAVDALEEADKLTADLHATAGSQFVCGNRAYRLEHRAIGFKPGNRDWLYTDHSVRVIE